MTQADLAAWVLAAIQSVAPAPVPERHHYPTARESIEDRNTRLEHVANSIAAAALSEELGPLGTPKRAAAYLVAIASLESGFARDVDVGPCDPQRIATGGCDRGQAKTLWQLRGVRGWPSRDEAARLALTAVRRSLQTCSRNRPSERLAVYACGRCAPLPGRSASRPRVELAERLASR